MSDSIVAPEKVEAIKQKAKDKEKPYKGMHNGTVSGKSFEASRRSRKSHAERRSEIASRNKPH